MTEDARRTCQYIAGDLGRDFDIYAEARYCGAPCRRLGDGWSSFCEEHHALCHTKRVRLPETARQW